VGGDYQGLGIVRSLGKRGIPVCVVDDERSIGRFSRYATMSARVAGLRDEEATVEALLEIGRRLDLEGWVLFPTRDETVAALSHARERLSEVFRVPTPPWTTIREVWDKRSTYRRAKSLDIPVPREYRLAAVKDVEALELDFPVALKPAIKEHFIYATKEKAWKASDPDELRRRHDEASQIVGPGEVIVQELIPGDGREQYAYCAFFKDGEALASMVVRRRRQHPPEFGRASTYVETVDVPEVAKLATRFLRAIDYYGLVEVEFKRDARDGRYKLLDVNARTWGYHSLGPAAGVDFPALLFADQVGESVEPLRAKADVRWMRLTTDLPTAVVEILRRRLGAWAYLKSLAKCDVEAVFAWNDPLPGLVEIALIPYLAVRRGF
jgi:D-aspartate ligase